MRSIILSFGGGLSLELEEKIGILATAAKYDASCSSSGGTRSSVPGGLGNSYTPGICHSWSGDGRCISLLKILLTNYCIYNCAYCVNRSSNDIPRAGFSVTELVDLTLNFYRRNYIEGLFLSSGIVKNPDFTMELLVEVARRLRREHSFNGYIHLKAIPGASSGLLKEAGRWADRLSVNIELPTEQSLRLLAPDKTRHAILDSLSYIGNRIVVNRDERQRFTKAPPFVPAGQSTQLIIGATPESDLQIIRLAEALYNRVNLKRVYYSAYVPVTSHPLLPLVKTPPLIRENRLYQADWLLRFYGFKATELLDPGDPFLSGDLDPKTGWALRNMQLFPVEIGRAGYEMLIRIPGIGLKSAQKIIAARRTGRVGFDQLSKFGVVLKRARYFITCNGRSMERLEDPQAVRGMLLGIPATTRPEPVQLTLFS